MAPRTPQLLAAACEFVSCTRHPRAWATGAAPGPAQGAVAHGRRLPPLPDFFPLMERLGRRHAPAPLLLPPGTKCSLVRRACGRGGRVERAASARRGRRLVWRGRRGPVCTKSGDGRAVGLCIPAPGRGLRVASGLVVQPSPAGAQVPLGAIVGACQCRAAALQVRRRRAPAIRARRLRGARQGGTARLERRGY